MYLEDLSMDYYLMDFHLNVGYFLDLNYSCLKRNFKYFCSIGLRQTYVMIIGVFVVKYTPDLERKHYVFTHLIHFIAFMPNFA